jgi:hypothetical protein
MAQTLGPEVTGGNDPIPVKLFRGYDTVARGILTDSAVAGKYENSGVSSGVRIEVCESLSKLAQALDIDASLSVSYLKAVDVTAKMEFARKLEVTARSVSIVVYAKHGIGTWDVTEAKLKSKVTAPVDDESAAAFVGTYGDSFIKSVTLGGEYFAVYVFNTETREEQQDLAASLKMEFKGGGASVKPEAQVKLSNFLNTTKTNWTLKQGMTGITDPEFPDQDKLVPFAIGFSKLKLDGPVATDLKVSGYENVEGLTKSFGKVAANRRYFLNPHNGLLSKLARLTAVSNQIDWLKQIYSCYNYKGDTALAAFAKRVGQDIEAIDAQVTRWVSNAAGDFAAPSLPSLAEGEPVLNFEEDMSPAWGGTTPGPWAVDSVGDLIRNRTRVKSIQLASGKFDPYTLLGRLIVEYVSDKRSWTETHGDGQVVTVAQRLDLNGQSPTRFEARHGTYLDWLKIYVSGGSGGTRSTEAGGPGGVRTEWAVPKDWFFVGFAGRSGSIIDQVQARYAKLEPATMVTN